MVATFVLHTERDRGFAIAAVMKARVGDKPDQVRISKPTRTNDDNAALHATLTAIADQLGWPPDTGELHSVEHWKRVLTLSWLRELKEMPEVIVDVTGETYGILVPHTSDLTSEQCKSLTQWCVAFGVSNGVQFKEPPQQPEPPVEAYEDQR